MSEIKDEKDKKDEKDEKDQELDKFFEDIIKSSSSAIEKLQNVESLLKITSASTAKQIEITKKGKIN